MNWALVTRKAGVFDACGEDASRREEVVGAHFVGVVGDDGEPGRDDRSGGGGGGVVVAAVRRGPVDVRGCVSGGRRSLVGGLIVGGGLAETAAVGQQRTTVRLGRLGTGGSLHTSILLFFITPDGWLGSRVVSVLD